MAGVTEELRKLFPHAEILGCSTGGQILGSEVRDDEVVAVGLSFSATRLKLAQRDHCLSRGFTDLRRGDRPSSIRRRSRGRLRSFRWIERQRQRTRTRHTSVIGNEIPLTGGLAGDGANSKKPWSAAIARPCRA